MALFGDKKPAKTDIPISQVVSMRKQGIDNNRIIQSLQREGYSSSQIFEAMNQADMAPAVNGIGPEEVKKEQENISSPAQPIDMPKTVQQPIAPDFSQTSFKQPSQPISSIPSFQEKSPGVEELVESVIEEKWDDLVKDITKIIEWKNETETRINSLKQEFTDLKNDFDKLHKAVLGKIGEYDKNILNVGADVKAMEKVFSKVLPVFTEKVNDLSKVADSFKKKN